MKHIILRLAPEITSSPEKVWNFMVKFTLINEQKLTHLSKTKSSTLHQLSMMDIYFLELRKGCRGYCLVNVFYFFHNSLATVATFLPCSQEFFYLRHRHIHCTQLTSELLNGRTWVVNYSATEIYCYKKVLRPKGTHRTQSMTQLWYFSIFVCLFLIHCGFHQRRKLKAKIPTQGWVC